MEDINIDEENDIDKDNNEQNDEANDLDNDVEKDEDNVVEKDKENDIEKDEDKEVDKYENNDEEKEKDKDENNDEEENENKELDKGDENDGENDEDKEVEKDENNDKEKDEDNDEEKNEDNDEPNEESKEESHIIKLKTSDGEIFEIKDKYLKRVKYLEEKKDILNLDEEIPLNKVDSKTLNKIIEYLMHYENEEPKKIPKPLPGPDLKSFLSKWDYNYISQISLEENITLINAAKYLIISELVNLACAKIGVELINCSIDAAKEKFGVKGDFTEEELREIDKYSHE